MFTKKKCRRRLWVLDMGFSKVLILDTAMKR
jgi:hypothetical protein